MGVTGLTSVVDQNAKKLLQDVHLHDTHLVIDGNNLAHWIYKYFNLYYKYGGEYYKYEAAVIKFFTYLKLCKIKPFVVLDGGISFSANKWANVERRTQERIFLAGFLAESKGDKKKCTVLPILCHILFINTLNQLKISHVTAPFEADKMCVQKANELKCPVLSNDSDFFIFQLDHGMILLDYLVLSIRTKTKEPPTSSSSSKKEVDDASTTLSRETTTITESTSYTLNSPAPVVSQDDKRKQRAERRKKKRTEIRFLNAQLFHQSTLVSYFPGLQIECLKILPCLVGNDLVRISEMKNFYTRAKMPSLKHVALKTGNQHKHILQVLKWLAHFESEAEASAMVLFYCSEPDKKTVAKTLAVVRESYNLNVIDSIADRNPQVHSLLTKFEKHLVTPLVQNALLSQKIIMKCQCEDLSQPSSFEPARLIRQRIYSLLFPPDSPITTVTEYGRRGNALERIAVPVAPGNADFPESVVAPGLKVDRVCETPWTTLVAVFVETLMDGRKPSAGWLARRDGAAKTVSQRSSEFRDHHNHQHTHNHVVGGCQGDADDDTQFYEEDTINVTDVLREDGTLKPCKGSQRSSRSGSFLAGPQQSTTSKIAPPIEDEGDDDDDSDFVTFPTHFSPMFHASLVFWLDNWELDSAKPNAQFPIALILSAIICRFVLKFHQAVDSEDTDVICTCGRDISVDCDKIRARLSTFIKAPIHDNLHPFQISIIHSFAMWQATLKASLDLNNVLGHPVDNVTPEIFQGSIIYNIVSDLLSREKPLNYVRDNLLMHTHLYQVFIEAFNFITKYVQNRDALVFTNWRTFLNKKVAPP